MYDIIGNVTDEKNLPIVGVLVDDGFNGTATDMFGYYEIKTDKKIVNFRMLSFKPQSFDLSVYRPNSAVNLDIKLKTDTDATTFKPVEIVAKRTPKTQPVEIVAKTTPTPTPEPIVVKEKGLLKKSIKIIGFSLLGVVLILTSAIIYKGMKKK